MLFLALRQLLSKKRQTFLTIAGITLGSGAYVLISGMMLGFQTYMIDQLVNNDAHIRISAREEPVEERSLDSTFFGNAARVFWRIPPAGRRDSTSIEHAQGWFERLNHDPRVVAYAPQLTVQAILRRAQTNLAVQVVGIDADRQAQVTRIESQIVEGRLKDLALGGNRVFIGDVLLKRLGARVGDTVSLTTSQGTQTPCRIAGVFHFGIKTVDESRVFANLSDTQSLNSTPSRITDIAVRLHDVSQAGLLAETWQLQSRDKVQSWDQANEGFLSVFRMQDMTRNSMTISILVVAAFGIYNILNMAVSQRKREIAILRSIGYEPKDVLYLFLSQGVLLGFVGGVVGLIVGYLACIWLSTVEVSPQRMMGGGRMLVSFSPWIYVKAFLLAFGSATIAGLLPARAAGKMTPIDIIRQEGS